MLSGKALRFLQTPIQRWLDDDDVSEIVANRPKEIGVECRGKWQWHDVPELDERTLDALGLCASNTLSKKFDPAHPICISQLPNEARATFVRHPVTRTPTFTIRIANRKAPQTIAEDERFEDAFHQPTDRLAADAQLRQHYEAKEMRSFFPLAVRLGKNIATIGMPKRGKTHLLRKLMREVERHRRVVTIENTAEFGEMPHIRNRVAMIFGSAGITATHCVEATFHMRPDVVALQEIKTGEELWAYNRLLALGEAGGFTSYHGDRDAPFEQLILMAKQTAAGQSMATSDLNRMFRKNIDIIVYCHKNEATDKYSHEIVWYKDVDYVA